MRWTSSVSLFMSCFKIALHFVEDKKTRFDLAVECGNLDVALEMATAIDRTECWNRLAQQALQQGNHKVRYFVNGMNIVT